MIYTSTPTSGMLEMLSTGVSSASFMFWYVKFCSFDHVVSAYRNRSYSYILPFDDSILVLLQCKPISPHSYVPYNPFIPISLGYKCLYVDLNSNTRGLAHTRSPHRYIPLPHLPAHHLLPSSRYN